MNVFSLTHLINFIIPTKFINRAFRITPSILTISRNRHLLSKERNGLCSLETELFCWCLSFNKYSRPTTDVSNKHLFIK